MTDSDRIASAASAAENLAASIPLIQKNALPLTTLGWLFSSITLNQMLTVASLIYVTLQIILLIPRFLAWYRGNPTKDD